MTKWCHVVNAHLRESVSLEQAGCDRPRRSVAVRSYPSPKVMGGDLERQAATVQEQPRGTTPRPRSGAVVADLLKISAKLRLLNNILIRHLNIYKYIAKKVFF